MSSAAPALRSTEERVRNLADAIEPVICDSEASPKFVTRSVIEAAARALLAGAGPLRMAFLARALNALAVLTHEMGEPDLGNATGASSDYQVLLYALETPDALASLQKSDPLAASHVRGLLARSRLLEAEGGTISVDEVATILGISRQAVEKRRRAGRLIGLATGRRGYRYPSWQFGPNGLLSGLVEALHAIDVNDEWMRASFFLNGNAYLGGESPLAELRRGHVADVIRAASAYGEQGAA